MERVHEYVIKFEMYSLARSPRLRACFGTHMILESAVVSAFSHAFM